MEMLVVIGIMALLMGILTPVLIVAKESARRTKARTETHQIALSWESYQNEYRTLPAGYSQMDEQAVLMLRGDAGQAANPKRMRFLEFTGDTSAGFKDPWGTTYRVALDSTGSGQVTAGNRGILVSNVAVWSYGKNGIDDGSSPDSDDIVSWRE